MTRAWCIVMRSGMEHCEEKGNGALCRKVLWIIVMTEVMEHCDEKRHGAL